MALIDSQIIIEAGIKPTFTSLAALSNTFTNDGREFIAVHYVGEGTIDLSVAVTFTEIDIQGYGDLEKASPSVNLSTGQWGYIGPFPTSAYSDLDGLATFTVTAFAGVSVAILSLS